MVFGFFLHPIPPVFFLSQVLIPNKHVTSQIASPSLFLVNPTCTRWAWQSSTLYTVLVAQLCLTLSNSRDGSPPGCSVHGILQARVLEWVAIPFSGVSPWPRDGTSISCISRIAGGLFTSEPPRKSLVLRASAMLLATTGWDGCMYSYVKVSHFLSRGNETNANFIAIQVLIVKKKCCQICPQTHISCDKWYQVIWWWEK